MIRPDVVHRRLRRRWCHMQKDEVCVAARMTMEFLEGGICINGVEERDTGFWSIEESEGG